MCLDSCLLAWPLFCSPPLRSDGNWWLTDRRSHEVARLPAPRHGGWIFLVVGGQGFLADGDSEPIPSETFFHWSCYDHLGRLLLVNDNLVDRHYVEDLCRAHKMATARFPGMSINIEAKVEVAIFDRARKGHMQCYLSLPDVLNALGIDFGNRVRANWIARYIASWEAYLFIGLGMNDGIMRSSLSPGSSVDGVDNMCRPLPFPSISFASIIALLCRWAFGRGKRSGGLQEPSQREYCKSLLRWLFAIFGPGLEVFWVYWDDSGREPLYYWPSPCPDRPHTAAKWLITPTCMCNFAEVCEKAPATETCPDMRAMLGYEGAMDLVDFLDLFWQYTKVWLMGRGGDCAKRPRRQTRGGGASGCQTIAALLRFRTACMNPHPAVPCECSVSRRAGCGFHVMQVWCQACHIHMCLGGESLLGVVYAVPRRASIGCAGFGAHGLRTGTHSHPHMPRCRSGQSSLSEGANWGERAVWGRRRWRRPAPPGSFSMSAAFVSRGGHNTLVPILCL